MTKPDPIKDAAKDAAVDVATSYVKKNWRKALRWVKRLVGK